TTAKILLVCEENGTRTVGLLLDFPLEIGSPVLSCRAFLIEPEVIKRLAALGNLPEELVPHDVLCQAFQGGAVRNNIELARLLAALPELDGEVLLDERCVRFQRLAVPQGFDTFPLRAEPLEVVVAVLANE